MSTTATSQGISFCFADNADPTKPVELDDKALAKMGDIPKLCHAFAESYGATVEKPRLWGGAVRLEIRSEPDMFKSATASMMVDLTQSARELEDNAQQQPPLPLAQAVHHQHCIALLHEMARVHDKSKLVATLVMEDQEIKLPQVPLSAFTEPERPVEPAKRIHQSVNGLCRPRNDANVIVLTNLTTIELPFELFPYDVPELHSKIFENDAHFSGWAMPVQRGVLRAMPGSQLLEQVRNQVPSKEESAAAA
jgi:hypothetical protein